MTRLLVIAVFCAANASIFALTSDEKSYLDHASKRAPLSEPTQDSILRFESDVTGDGLTEVFYSKESFRDGGLGYLWTVYSLSSRGSLIPLGDVTFSSQLFKPSPWDKDPNVRGFYTFSRAGAGMGSLTFFEVGVGGITERERVKIAPTGADKELYDRLFSTGTGTPVGVTPEQIAIPADYSPDDPADQIRRPRPSTNSETDTPVPNDLSAPTKESTSGNSSATTKATAAGLFLLISALGWMIYKRRSS